MLKNTILFFLLLPAYVSGSHQPPKPPIQIKQPAVVVAQPITQSATNNNNQTPSNDLDIELTRIRDKLRNIAQNDPRKKLEISFGCKQKC